MASSKLTVLKVEKLSETGRYADGGGLYLNISKDGTKSWLLRYQINSKRRWKGLGGYHPKSNSLASARARAFEEKALLCKGIDPLDYAQEIKQQKMLLEKQALSDKRLSDMTFEQCALRYIKKMTPEWSNKKHIQQWENTLRTYAFPFIGNMAVQDIETEHVKRCLDPIWETKTETANRVRQRIESVLHYAIANKYRTSSNPAIWKGLLDNLYPKPEKVKAKRYEKAGQEKHHNALPYTEIATFMEQLKKVDGVSAKALQFTILTACRTGEVRFAQWSEFDFDKKEWNIPKGRMKKRKEHRVALPDDAIKLLNEIPRLNEFVFPGIKIGKPISDGSMSAVLKRMKRTNITVHGFRSTFRDYIGEETGFPHRLAEFALAHGLTDDSEKAYARGDQFKKRFEMMNAWAKYINSNR